MNSDIAAAVRQWVAKADVDWTTVEILRRDQRCPGAAVCFHCQQYVEKLLKAFLTIHQIEAPRTHDLRRLIQLVGGRVSELDAMVEPADVLSFHAVEGRYPGDQPEISPEEVREMVELAREFAALLLPKLQVNE